MFEKMKVGKRIALAREYRKMSRTQLADAIDQNYRDILRWETTDREPHLATLKKIAEVLRIDFDYFLLDDESDIEIVYFLEDKDNPLYRDIGGHKIEIQQCFNKTSDLYRLRQMAACIISAIDPKQIREAREKVEQIYYEELVSNQISYKLAHRPKNDPNKEN